MASVRADEIPKIQSFFTDFWVMIKSYWKPEDTDQYWDELVTHASALANKYDNDEFCKCMVLQFVDYCEWKSLKETDRKMTPYKMFWDKLMSGKFDIKDWK